MSPAIWRKSSRSDSTGQCVEVADNLPGVVAVRDSKNPDQATLTFAPDSWAAFVREVKGSEFDL